MRILDFNQNKSRHATAFSELNGKKKINFSRSNMQGIVITILWIFYESIDWKSKIPYVKSVQIWNYFWSLFSCIQCEYKKTRTGNNSVSEHFSSSDYNLVLSTLTEMISDRSSQSLTIHLPQLAIVRRL